MAGTLKVGKKGMITEINVTPMVDVVLVLLVIMMVSATYIVSQSLKVELPKAANGADSVQSLAAVTIAKGGGVYYNQKPIAESELAAKLHEAHANNPEVNLIVSADKEVPHGKVVHVIDVARGEGIFKFAINVEVNN
ncbi:MAG TPA: biopolymer transporter ExbD [Polyangiaceae bacterium]|nr:biopolymer transporter ExbD [Polyangiaceae bacterium]